MFRSIISCWRHIKNPVNLINHDADEVLAFHDVFLPPVFVWSGSLLKIDIVFKLPQYGNWPFTVAVEFSCMAKQAIKTSYVAAGSGQKMKDVR